jgi:hypothetical protein
MQITAASIKCQYVNIAAGTATVMHLSANKTLDVNCFQNPEPKIPKNMQTEIALANVIPATSARNPETISNISKGKIIRKVSVPKKISNVTDSPFSNRCFDILSVGSFMFSIFKILQ